MSVVLDGALAIYPLEARLSSAKRRAARSLDETRVQQQRHDRRLRDRLAIEALDREPLHARPADVVDECRERFAEPVVLQIAQRHERAAAALDEQRRLAAQQDDPCARDSGCPGAVALRPGQGGAV